MESNHNVVRLLDETYFGFDPRFFGSSKNHEEVEKLLCDCFIKPEDVEREEEHKKYVQTLQSNPLIFATMRESYQRREGFYKFNMEKVKSFIEEG